MPESTALKEIFAAVTFRAVAKAVAEIHPGFDRARFLALSLDQLDELSLMQRLRRMTESLHATLPANFPKALSILRKLAPKIERSFVTLVLPDCVSQYGLAHFDLSMEALRFFTSFGSSEFGIRPFLRHDQARALAIMTRWAADPSEHVRRLASEGCRPRLPWSFRLDALIADPTPALPILEQLRTDPSLYVRKSVANHLNDITKDHPDWVLDLLARWPLENKHTAWIAKRALRTLIKRGDRRALAVIGAGAAPALSVQSFTVSPKNIRLGESIDLRLSLQSTARDDQRLVIDYTIHYVKKAGTTTGKVFKWKEAVLPPGAQLTLARTLTIRDFTTRVHHAGRHAVEIMANGTKVAEAWFELAV